MTSTHWYTKSRNSCLWQHVSSFPSKRETIELDLTLPDFFFCSFQRKRERSNRIKNAFIKEAVLPYAPEELTGSLSFLQLEQNL